MFIFTCHILMDILSGCSQMKSSLDCPLVHRKLCASQEADGLFHVVRLVAFLQGVTEKTGGTESTMFLLQLLCEH